MEHGEVAGPVDGVEGGEMEGMISWLVVALFLAAVIDG